MYVAIRTDTNGTTTVHGPFDTMTDALIWAEPNPGTYVRTIRPATPNP